jgi:hypothetical protein
MPDALVKTKRSLWRPSLYAAATACGLFLPLLIYSPDADIFYLFIGVPVVGFIFLIATLASQTLRQRLAKGLALLLFLAVSLVLLRSAGALRPHLRWLLWSHHWKSEVLAQSNVGRGELRHVEWDGDGSGGVPVGDWTRYVVYDPSDSLPITGTNEPPKRIAGVPCAVVVVRYLEKYWYSVVTDMNQFWDKMHPNC